MNILTQIVLLFGGLSLLAFGGGNAVIPDMQRAVIAHGWMGPHTFLDLYALSRIAPGPGTLIVTLIGQHVAGMAGAVAATLAMFTPSCTLVYLAGRFWRRFAEAPWRAVVERALAPIGVGLTYATGIALVQGTETSFKAMAVTAAATLALTTTRLHPLLVLGAGAVAGLVLGL
jgi:chromate transporter